MYYPGFEALGPGVMVLIIAGNQPCNKGQKAQSNQSCSIIFCRN